MNTYFATLGANGHLDPFRLREDAGNSRATLHAPEFDISVMTGFLPHEPPIVDLTFLGHGWDAAERLLGEAQTLIADAASRDATSWDAWLRQIDELELDVNPLIDDVRRLRRAHVVLSFVGHVYARTCSTPVKLPEGFAGAWVWVSRCLQCPPVLTYADTVLWNWRLLDPAKPMAIDNISIATTFTESETEKAFYMLSLLCEAYSPRALRAMMLILDECFVGDEIAQRRIAGHLEALQQVLGSFSELLDAAIRISKGATDRESEDTTAVYCGPCRERRIDADTFYTDVREWLRGGPWTYGKHDMWSFGGPSAGQSTMVHALDIILGVDHRGATDSHDDTFMDAMSWYMPGPHRMFLRHLQRECNSQDMSSLRALVETSGNDDLVLAYNRTIDAMIAFRNAHMRLTAFFIIAPARRHEKGATGLKGTGGTHLVSFLKQCLLNTVRARLE